MKRPFVIAALLLSSPAFAQQEPQQRQMTPVEMSGAIAAAVEQGNIARSMHIQAEAKAAGLADDLAKAQAKIKELTPQKEQAAPKP